MGFKTRKKIVTILFTVFLLWSVFNLVESCEGEGVSGSSESEGFHAHKLQKRNTWTEHYYSESFANYDPVYGDHPYFDLKSNLQTKNGLKSTIDNADNHYDDAEVSGTDKGIIDGNGFNESDVVYIGCIDAWYAVIRDQFVANKFDTSFNHSSCAKYCKDEKPDTQISFLRGGDCRCLNTFYPKPFDFVNDARCNVPCPVSSPVPFIQQTNENSCGGNRYYSIYCYKKGSEDCLTYQSSPKPSTLLESQLGLLNNEEPGLTSDLLYMSCASCNVKSCSHPIVTPSYDYFPRNKPEDNDGCIMFCKYAVKYTEGIDGESYAVRPGTVFALLLWQNDPKNEKPICHCTNDISKFSEEEANFCTSPCPGNGSTICGERYLQSHPIRATVYCTNTNCLYQTSSTTEETEIDPTTETELSITSTSTTEPNDSETTSSQSTPTTLGTVTTSPPTSTPTPTTTSEPVSTTKSSYTTSSMESSTAASRTTSQTSPATTSGTNPEIGCSAKCTGTEIRTGQSWTVCAGDTVNEACGQRSKGTYNWRCSYEGKFETEQPDYSGCHSDWIEAIEEEVKNINDTRSTLEYLAKIRREILENAKTPYFGHEIRNVTEVLIQATQKSSTFAPTAPEFEDIAVGVINVTESLIQAREPWLQINSTFRSDSSTRLLKSIEKVSLTLTSKAKPSPETGISYEKHLTLGTSFNSEYFVSVGALHKTQTGNHIFSRDQDQFSFPQERLPHSSYILLPPEWKDQVPGDKIEYVGYWMNAELASLLLPGQYHKLGESNHGADKRKNPEGQRVKMINGKLMSFTLGSPQSGSITSVIESTRNGEKTLTDTVMLHENRRSLDDSSMRVSFPGRGVQITFEHDVEAWGETAVDIRRRLHTGEVPKAALGSGQCVFWDTNALTWSTAGCKTVSNTRHRTVCECDHLTSFALLMDVHNYTGKDTGLEILTLILCSFSFICLFASIMIFSVMRGVQNLRTSITKNLSVCLLLGNTMVLLVIDRNYFNLTDGVCVATGIITHYIFLAAFLWMVIEGIHLYKMVVYVFDTERNPINIYRLIAYGLPLLTVAVTVTTGYLKGDRPYGGDVVCWLQDHYIWSFLVPVAVVVMVNFTILFIALKTAYQLQHNANIPAHHNRVRTSKTWIKGCFSITVLLGLTWLLGFFTLVPSSPGIVAAYLFTALNASQGIFIFIFHCALNEKVQTATNKKFGNYLPSWLSISQDSRSMGNDVSGLGKGTVSNMQRSNIRGQLPRIRNQSSILSTTVGTDGSQSSLGPKVRPKIGLPASPPAHVSKNEVCMNETGEGTGEVFVISPRIARSNSFVRKRDSFGSISSADWTPVASDSDKSQSSRTGLISSRR